MKKFLSLVLTLALAMSLVTVSAGATDFDDDGDITYQEAVTVIAGLGIVDGYSDGSFGPDEVLTRGAAAKIICNLILGPTTASALSASSAPFVDVPVTNTFAGYITYCSQAGIISGYADGTFRPTGTLSGNAFMKMLLGALGYDSESEGYTGANWNVSVIKQAVGIGLDDGNDNFLGSQAVTREEACLYAFNTLQATMVEYETKNTIIVGDVQVNTTSTRSDVANTTKSDGNIDEDELMQFAEKYFDDLVAEGDTDGFGRPATTWVYDGDELGTYADDADELYVLDDEYDLEALLTDGDCLNYSSKDVLDSATVYYNGTDEGEYDALSDDVLAGKGDILEVFENDDGDVETIVFRSYTYAKIDEVITDLSSTHENKGASVGIDLVDIEDTSLGTYYDDYNDDDKVLNGYNSDYTEGTVLAVAISEDDAILDSYVMESITGTPSAAKMVEYGSANDRGESVVESGTITIDGTKYTYAAQMTGIDDQENVDFDEEYTIYLTSEGYVLAIDGDSTAALNDVYYVAGVYSETSKGRTSYYVEAVSVSDGTYYELELSDAGESDFNTRSLLNDATYDASVAGLYILDEDDDEYFVEEALEDGDEVGSYTVVASEYSGSNGLSQDVNRDSTTIRFSNSSTSRLYLADNTFFVSVEGEAGDESLSISTATGVMTVDSDTSTNLSAYAFYKSDDNDAVFVVYAADDLAGAVNMSDIVYLTDDADNATSDGYLVDLFFLDGMNLEEDITIDSKEDQGFYTYEVDDDGIYELSSNTSYEVPGDENNEVDDDADGYAEEVTFTDVRSNRATGTYTDNSDDEIEFVAVSFANASIIDTRSSSSKNNDLYSGDIESASALSSAINRGWVVADVYVDDGEIVFVAVRECEDTASTAGSLSVSPATVTVTAGDTETVTVSGTNIDSITSVSSSNTSVATATISGSTITVSGVAAGTATITVTALDDEDDTCTATIDVTVQAVPASLTLGEDLIELVKPGSGKTQVEYISVSTTACEIVDVESDSTAIAAEEVTISGSDAIKVTVGDGVTPGETYEVTVTAMDASLKQYTETLEIYIKSNDTSLDMNADDVELTTSNGSITYTVSEVEVSGTTVTVKVSMSGGSGYTSGDTMTVNIGCADNQATSDPDSITVTYKTIASDSVSADGWYDEDGNKLSETKTTFTVTAEDGTTQTYTLKYSAA